KFMTDGILLAEAHHDRQLRAYDTLVVDEAHERTLNIDFILGWLKKLLPRRPDLKVIITSATIDPRKFSAAFDNAPLIEVSGRMYPVEVRYRPLPVVTDDDSSDVTYLDRAVSAVDEIKHSGHRGDVLVFMPTESDIRETVQRLEDRNYLHTRVLPLFGRMAAVDQERIFHPSVQDKIVVATNVAETSVTIPGIRYVVDTGLARIAQYNARSRTQTLPILPISQASADQRMGRCGRVEAGICIRLYDENDYLSRPHYTAPEIQRSNLAEVILRMLYLGLGEVQLFPFLDPPAPAAIKDGFAVLQELGAVDEHRRLTAVGRTMARLPLDPRQARILITARQENALREVTILAAALSVQDPRERPLDQEAQADQAHARFRHPQSDFGALLRIWEEYQRIWETTRSQGQMRKFCRQHFLSYRRIREWIDIHEQLHDVLNELGDFPVNAAPASYDAVHRSLVSGYLSNLALRKEKNHYLATKGREVMIHPGSGLFNKAGSWIVAAEMVQTSRTYARLVANVEPDWLEGLGRHLCRHSYSDPHWEKNRGQVVAYERVTLYGLTIVERRKVNYARIQPEEARAVFIRSALIEGDLPGRYPFLEFNRELLKSIEDLENRTRRRDLLVDEQVLFDFYDRNLPAIADIRSLNRFLKEPDGDSRLRMTEADLLRATPDFAVLDDFPTSLGWHDPPLALRYVFSPGEEDDGVTAAVPVHLLPRMGHAGFEWLVPGMLPEKVLTLLKALPKGLRRQVVPIQEFARRVVDCLEFGQGDFYTQLTRIVKELTGMEIYPKDWGRSSLPDHLRMRFEVLAADGKVLNSGRDLMVLTGVSQERHDEALWHEARQRWERDRITDWDFGELPSAISLGKDAFGIERLAYPGLVAEGQSVSLQLFADPLEATNASREGLLLLFQHVFSAELKHLLRTWRLTDEIARELRFLGDRQSANRALQRYILSELFGIAEIVQPSRDLFLATVARLRGGQLAARGRQILEEVLQVIHERHLSAMAIDRYQELAAQNPGAQARLHLLAAELDSLLPKDFLNTWPHAQIVALPRYLQALRIRAERAYHSPDKDRTKAEHLVPHVERYEALRSRLVVGSDPDMKRFLEEFHALLEEFKISLFAPEIKTMVRVSSKILDSKWKEGLLMLGSQADVRLRP
ncbi:MAG TPA: ATP-dependent RNA helicase HrpA, partial [Syntrophobacteraceae bacterium]|nr:ATP-dependent RNA helicase HrpA [Syntrophobacteraceae bacterium]